MQFLDGDRLLEIYVPPDQHLRSEIQLAVCRYFAQGADLTPTEADYEAWWPGLPGPLSAIGRGAGFGRAQENPSFRRFVLETRGFSLYEHLTEHLSPEALALWRTLQMHGAGLDPNAWSFRAQLAHGR